MANDDQSASRLVMTPQLQMAIRMLSMTQVDLFAMVAEWRAKHPGAITELPPGEPDPAAEEDDGWTVLEEPPLPPAATRPDVWVFGNPPRARANPSAIPRVKVVFDEATLSRSALDVREASWLARALRQRLKMMERVVAQLVVVQPRLAVELTPDSLPGVDAREVAEAIGVHESTVQRVAGACRYQTIHGVVQLVTHQRTIQHRAIG